jgi:hypothetical protein
MPRTSDSIARAYATIGLRRGCSGKQLKDQYRHLVRMWHPDRWAGDPTGQAEAAQRMRAINQAYALLLDSVPSAESQPSKASHLHQELETQSQHQGRALSDAELDALVRAIGTENPVYVALRYLSWTVPMLAAYLYVVRATRFGTSRDWFLSATFFLIGAGVLIRQLVNRRS